ncbi:MAG: hypothetical protein J6N52_13770 [Clostridia bacterium]|nr:hypothetical protein [Clostridia bacterium]
MLTANINAAAENIPEEFAVEIGMLTEKQLSQMPQIFTPIDLKKYVNRDIRDDVAGDFQGGWSDQGENDLRMFNSFGKQEMLGIPFDFINPAQNNQKAVLGLRGQNDSGLPTKVEIPIDRVTAGAYFVHASPWASGNCGKYSWVYSDGSESYVNIAQNIYICDFWGKASYDYCRPVWSVQKGDGTMRSLYLFAMNNPHPEKKVKNLKLETEGSGAYIMIMGITLTDSGPYLPATENSKKCTTSTYGWYEYKPEDVEKIENSPIDFSFLIDAPAGKHGRVSSNGEKLKFENGTEAKFWGADISGEACFPEKSEAVKVAKRIAQMGVNLIRFRNFDNGLFNGTIHSSFDKDKEDRFLFFISELKKNGVYSYISAVSNFEYYAADNVPEFSKGFGIEGYFCDELISMQKKYFKMLLDLYNPYTEMKLIDDPAIAFVEVCSDKSAFMFEEGYGDKSVKSPEYKEEIRLDFNNFLASKYVSDKNLKEAWGDTDKNDNESLDDKSIKFNGSWQSPIKTDVYKNDVFNFIMEAENKYFSEMKKISGDILFTGNTSIASQMSKHRTAKNGDSIPLAYSDKSNELLLREQLLKNSDFSAKNFIFAKALSKTNEKPGSAIMSDVFFSPTDNPLVSGFKEAAENAIYNKPYVSGYGAASPNLYFSAFPVMAGAIGGQNNWNMIYYNIANGSYQNGEAIENVYSAFGNPVRSAMLGIGAQIFYTVGNINNTEVKVNDEILGGASVDFKKFICKNSRFSLDKSHDSLPAFDNDSLKVIKTDNIYWASSDGYFEVRTPNSEAMTGFYDFENEMPSFKMSSDNIYTTAALCAIDNKKISESDRLLFTAACGAQNSGSLINVEKNIYLSEGKAPILVEGISGNVTLKLKGDYSVYSLDSSGQRTGRVGVSKDSNGYTKFKITNANNTIFYEIVRGD